MEDNTNNKTIIAASNISMNSYALMGFVSAVNQIQELSRELSKSPDIRNMVITGKSHKIISVKAE